MSEFYNRSVGEVVEVGLPMPYELPHREGRIEDGTLRDVRARRSLRIPSRPVRGLRRGTRGRE